MKKFFLTSRFFTNFFKNFIKILLLIFAINISIASASENSVKNFFNSRLEKLSNFSQNITNANNGNNNYYKNLQIENEEKNIFTISENILSGKIFSGENKNIQPVVFLTFPNGSVSKFFLPSDVIGKNNFVKNNIFIPFSVFIQEEGEYVIEFLDDRGLIFYKQKIWFGNKKSENTVYNTDVWENFSVKNIFTDVNSLRQSLGNSILQYDETLEKIALRKAVHMAENQYIWHQSLDGKQIFDFVLREEKNFLRIGENVAGGRHTNVKNLSQWLFDSPAHRYNMIFPAWKKVGMAVLEKDGNMYLVQVFSD